MIPEQALAIERERDVRALRAEEPSTVLVGDGWDRSQEVRVTREAHLDGIDAEYGQRFNVSELRLTGSPL
ncbi:MULTISPECIES: hypothetical protein [Sorangium]|uniref:hypothetical protein n=1 Tax=Sorangium TaxID=39643 RepID=UPI003D9C0BD1